MIFNHRQLVLSIVIVSFSHFAFADSYVEKKLPFSETPAKTWTQGLKQRIEMTVPFFGAGPSITIFRLDKKVQWTLQPNDETYFESTLAPASHPAPPQASSPPCTPEWKRLKETRVIAGHTATAYQETCRETPNQHQIYWMAESRGVPQNIKNDEDRFLAAQTRLNKTSIPAIAKKKSFILALEFEKDGRKTKSYEVMNISNDKLNDALFEIPKGYQKLNPFEKLIQKKLELQGPVPQK